MFRLSIVALLLAVAVVVHSWDDSTAEMMRRIEQLANEIAERRRIRIEKRKNLQFENEAIFNISSKRTLKYPRSLDILQLIGKAGLATPYIMFGLHCEPSV